MALERCPVCKGIGTAKLDYHGNVPSNHSCFQPRRCHFCNGKGWIRIHDTYPKRPNMFCDEYPGLSKYFKRHVRVKTQI